MQRIQSQELKNILIRMDNLLMSVEVKGDSVGNLYTTRILLKSLFDNLEEIAEEKKEE